MPELHAIQISVLHSLRHHADGMRFSALMRPTGLTSDNFKFHVRKLVADGYVEKTGDGIYRLTPAGKEFANTVDEQRNTIQRQPKLSVLVLVREPGGRGQPRYLFQERRRSPYYGYWSCIGGPVQWGEDATDTATNELRKQTGLQARCEIRGFYRVNDIAEETGELLEDKLFIILEAADVQGVLSNEWYGGHNQWMTEQEFKQQPRYFSSVLEALAMIRTDQTYMAQKKYYSLEEY
jgi:ADP-ribose pyrophosphatase YjhB (NUDIX family)/predicted transcriptional regulator